MLQLYGVFLHKISQRHLIYSLLVCALHGATMLDTDQYLNFSKTREPYLSLKSQRKTKCLFSWTLFCFICHLFFFSINTFQRFSLTFFENLRF